MTFAGPAAFAGVVAWIGVALTTVTFVAGAVPNNTSAPARKFVPVIVTVVPPAVGPLLGIILVTVGVSILYRKFTLDKLDWPLTWTITPALPARWPGVTATICEELVTGHGCCVVPPNVTVAPDAKLAPLIVTVVPPEVGPEDGEMLLTTGVEGAAILTLKPAVAVLPEESFAWTVNENAPDCEGVPEICPLDA